jgi:DNA-binding LytR/AlgR family response regulator
MSSHKRPRLHVPRGVSSIAHCQVIAASDDADAPARRLVVGQGTTVCLVPIGSIRWISTSGEVLCLHLTTCQLFTPGVLRALTKTLGAGYMRINRRTTVKLSAIGEIRRRGRRGEASVVLDDGVELTVSRRFGHDLHSWIADRSSSPQSTDSRAVHRLPSHNPGGLS